MRVVLVHGFNVRDGGARSVDRLAPGLIERGHTVDVDEADYGFYGLLMVRLFKRFAISRLENAFKKADAIVTHSNGANFTTKALRRTLGKTRPLVVFHLSPALNRSTPVPLNVERAFVFFTRRDFWVKLAAYLPFHPWGSMGAYGARTDDPRVTNLDRTESVDNHSGWFQGDNAERFAAEIADLIESTENEITQRKQTNAAGGS